MENSVQVTIYVQVYNTEPYLKQCIDSILSQTYKNFRCIITDNGSTDNCKSILENYAKQDSRIVLIRYEKNQYIDLPKFIQTHVTTPFFANLDSDDWWEPDYLKRLVKLALDTNADIVSTGTLMHIEPSGQTSTRQVAQPIILDSAQYAAGFPLYHVFFRTIWAKLIRTEICLAATNESEQLKALQLSYGGDTVIAFTYLRKSKRICLDNSVLHHYRIHKKSSSYQYDSDRFSSDVYLYNDAIDFLSAYGPVSAQNRNFLQCVYSNALIDTTGVIQNSSLPPADKLREYRTIATHSLTQAAYRECTDESAVRSRAMLMELILQAGAALKNSENDDLQTALQTLAPLCGKVVTVHNLPLFLQEKPLFQCLLADDADALVRHLLTYISQNKYSKKYDLINAVQTLAEDKPLLRQIENVAFFRKYSELYMTIWRGDTLSALEEMTGVLLEQRVEGGKETFLQLYISLAALEDQAPAFVFGKFQIAWLYLRQDKLDMCQAVVEELIEMGADTEELTALQHELGSRR